MLGGPGAWNLVGIDRADQLRVPWFDETTSEDEFVTCAESHLDAVFGVDHDIIVNAVVEVSPPTWTPQTGAPPVLANRLTPSELERIAGQAQAPRYALVAIDSIIVCDEEEALLHAGEGTPMHSFSVGGGSHWDNDIDRTLDALGLKAPSMPDWFWFRTM